MPLSSIYNPITQDYTKKNSVKNPNVNESKEKSKSSILSPESESYKDATAKSRGYLFLDTGGGGSRNLAVPKSPISQEEQDAQYGVTPERRVELQNQGVQKAQQRNYNQIDREIAQANYGQKTYVVSGYPDIKGESARQIADFTKKAGTVELSYKSEWFGERFPRERTTINVRSSSSEALKQRNAEADRLQGWTASELLAGEKFIAAPKTVSYNTSDSFPADAVFKGGKLELSNPFGIQGESNKTGFGNQKVEIKTFFQKILYGGKQIGSGIYEAADILIFKQVKGMKKEYEFALNPSKLASKNEFSGGYSFNRNILFKDKDIKGFNTFLVASPFTYYSGVRIGFGVLGVGSGIVTAVREPNLKGFTKATIFGAVGVSAIRGGFAKTPEGFSPFLAKRYRVSAADKENAINMMKIGKTWKMNINDMQSKIVRGQTRLYLPMSEVSIFVRETKQSRVFNFKDVIKSDLSLSSTSSSSGQGNSGFLVFQKLMYKQVDLGKSMFSIIGKVSVKSLFNNRFGALGFLYSKNKYQNVYYENIKPATAIVPISKSDAITKASSAIVPISKSDVATKISPDFMYNTYKPIYKPVYMPSLKANIKLSPTYSQSFSFKIVQSLIPKEKVSNKVSTDVALSSMIDSRIDVRQLSEISNVYRNTQDYMTPIGFEYIRFPVFDFDKKKDKKNKKKLSLKFVGKSKLKKSSVYVLPDLQAVFQTEAYNYSRFGRGEAVAPRLTKDIYRSGLIAFKGYGVGFIPTEQMRTGRIKL